MITTENIKIRLQLPTDTEHIETSLHQLGIKPLRWAITAVDGEMLNISVSYEK